MKPPTPVYGPTLKPSQAPGVKQCSCCGREAGKWVQWFNRDTAFGICARCADEEFTRKVWGLQTDPVEFFKRYGEPGKHFEGTDEMRQAYDNIHKTEKESEA